VRQYAFTIRAPDEDALDEQAAVLMDDAAALAYACLDPVALLAEIRSAQDELGDRVDRRAGAALPNAAPGKNDLIVCRSTPGAGGICPEAWQQTHARRTACDTSAAQAAL
jgi:hypothetical protein